MDGSYAYRNRPLNREAMRELIPKLYAGQTKTRAEIIDGVEQQHRRRGGAATEGRSNRGPLVGVFKGAAVWLQDRGAIENAGFDIGTCSGNLRRHRSRDGQRANSLEVAIARATRRMSST